MEEEAKGEFGIASLNGSGSMTILAMMLWKRCPDVTKRNAPSGRTGLTGQSAASLAEEAPEQKSATAFSMTDHRRMIRWIAETAEVGTRQKIATRILVRHSHLGPNGQPVQRLAVAASDNAPENARLRQFETDNSSATGTLSKRKTVRPTLALSGHRGPSGRRVLRLVEAEQRQEREIVLMEMPQLVAQVSYNERQYRDKTCHCCSSNYSLQYLMLNTFLEKI